MNNVLDLFQLKFVKTSQVYENMIVYEVGIANSTKTLLHWVYQTVFRTGASYKAEQILATDWSNKVCRTRVHWESWQNKPYKTF